MSIIPLQKFWSKKIFVKNLGSAFNLQLCHDGTKKLHFQFVSPSAKFLPVWFRSLKFQKYFFLKNFFQMVDHSWVNLRKIHQLYFMSRRSRRQRDAGLKSEIKAFEVRLKNSDFF